MSRSVSYHSGAVLHRIALSVLVLVGFFAVAPAGGGPIPVIPARVTIAGVEVGGLIEIAARERVERTYGSPIHLFHKSSSVAVSPARFGAKAAIDAAVKQSITAAPGADIPLNVAVKSRAVNAFVRELDRRFAKAPVDAKILGLTDDLKPDIAPAHPGREVDRSVMRRRILGALHSSYRTGAIRVKTVPVAPAVKTADLGAIIVIRRTSNRLTLFNGPKLARRFRVATGQAAYPTPLGDFEIVIKERDPTWNPPDSDWAKDAKPIPPGPGNPLGTRWMGISSPAVGIHGTPDAASLGYSASHGCIRMGIPDAEWLFEHVEVGTPVFIVAA
jgi:lipoprotein-anchoring transpeptidase ErfK/SrfK